MEMRDGSVTAHVVDDSAPDAADALLPKQFVATAISNVIRRFEEGRKVHESNGSHSPPLLASPKSSSRHAPAAQGSLTWIHLNDPLEVHSRTNSPAVAGEAQPTPLALGSGFPIFSSVRQLRRTDSVISAGVMSSFRVGNLALDDLSQAPSLAVSRRHSMAVAGCTLCTVIPDVLYLGSHRDVCQLSNARAAGIRAFLCVAQEIVDPLPAFVTDLDVQRGAVAYQHLKLKDGPTTILKDHISALFQFIDEQSQRGRPVVIYCQQGKSRSVSFAIAYMMRHHRIDAKRALENLRSVYPRADPNLFFLHQLDELFGNLPPPLLHAAEAAQEGDGSDEAPDKFANTATPATNSTIPLGDDDESPTPSYLVYNDIEEEKEDDDYDLPHGISNGNIAVPDLT